MRLSKFLTKYEYNAATGMYNYGYKDYRPQAARFTTVDPVRDGNNQ
jgi:RHS repeat-associated protein